jgi:hypothetical protein
MYFKELEWEDMDWIQLAQEGPCAELLWTR